MDIKFPIENEYMKCVLQINGAVVRVPGSGPSVESGRVKGRDIEDIEFRGINKVKDFVFEE